MNLPFLNTSNGRRIGEPASTAERDALIFKLEILKAAVLNPSRIERLQRAIHLLETGEDWRFDGNDLLVYPVTSTAEGVRLNGWKEQSRIK